MLIDFFNSKRTIILDGAMGTELQTRGYNSTLPLWSAKANIDAAELVYDIHKDYIEAGADIITTNTFRTTKRTFNKTGEKELAVEATQKAIDIANKAVGDANREALVAVSITSLEDCYRPDLVPEIDEMEEEHSFQIKLISKMNIDLFLFETINSISELKVLMKYVAMSNIPFIVSLVSNGEGKLLSGERITKALDAIKKSNPLAVMLNCRSPRVLDNDLQYLRKDFTGYIGAYANGAGMPGSNLGWKFFEENSMEQFIYFAKKWIFDGVKIIGGCCGTSPDYIKEIYNLINK